MNIGIFFGSRSPEHDVSIITASLVMNTLAKLNYKVTPIYISEKGEWFVSEDIKDLNLVTLTKANKEVNSNFKKIYLDLENSFGKMVFKRKGINRKEITIDIAFPCFHGSFGEDGTIQGLFELLSVPYVGCNVQASVVAMDKILSKRFAESLGVPTSRFTNLTTIRKIENISELKDTMSGKDLTFPLFVKPPKLGSSIGITKVNNLEELNNAIEVAFHYDRSALVEESVENTRDLTVCLIGNKEIITSEIQESAFSKDMYSYEDKYLENGGSQIGNNTKKLIIPAEIDKDIAKKIKEDARKLYLNLECKGMARFDFLLNDKTGEYFFSEINPLPGTIYSHLWAKSGITLEQLVTKLVEYAKEEYEEKQKVTYVFNSTILSNLKGLKFGK
ncbi:MAG: D-alanine--D-alanine ligase family protein [bacterium]